MRSSAAFADKVRGFGIEGDQAKAINDKYKTIGAFVVCCGYNAERVTDEMLIDKVVKETCGWSGTPPEPAYANNVRQLFWECLNMQMADTRYRHESCADEAPRPINALEREDRRDKIKAKYEDFIPEIYEGKYEPAHCIEDDLGAMEGRNRLDRYLGPADCPMRSQETSRPTMRPNSWRPKAFGAPGWVRSLQAQDEETPQPVADISEIHLLDYAFKRRGLGFVFHDLLSFKDTETWRRKLMNALDQIPILASDEAPGSQTSWQPTRQYGI